MRISIAVLIAVTCCCLADQAMQTDWSGGDGILGPVTDFNNEFFMSADVSCSHAPGELSLSRAACTPVEHAVDGNYYGAYSVYSQDVDGDGDMDVLGASQWFNEITWWENADGTGTSWVKHIIDGNFHSARSVYAQDVDGDGYMDVLGASHEGALIAWWENSDTEPGSYWNEHTIDVDFDGAHSVYARDIDCDGYMDVLGAAYGDDEITWWENEDGSGRSWIEHKIDENFNSAWAVYAEDIDGDGDMDVMGAAASSEYITWWENLDSSGTSWAEHKIEGHTEIAISVYSQDVDGDGNMDILGATWDGGIIWWENEDGSGTGWTRHTVCGEYGQARWVYAEDIDGDGYMDVLGAASQADKVTWWENEDGSGTSWIEHTIDGDYSGAHSVYAQDLDGDGYMDVLGASWSGCTIDWWSVTNFTSSGWLESSILDTQVSPDWQYLDWTCSEPGNTSVSFQVRASDDINNMGPWSSNITSPGSLSEHITDQDSLFQYRAYLSTCDVDSAPVLHDITVSWDAVGIARVEGVELRLLPVSPNPSSGFPVLRFSVPECCSVDLSVFDLSGRLVREVREIEYSPGYHEIPMEIQCSGVYLCRLTAGGSEAARRFAVIR